MQEVWTSRPSAWQEQQEQLLGASFDACEGCEDDYDEWSDRDYYEALEQPRPIEDFFARHQHTNHNWGLPLEWTYGHD